MCQKKKLDPFVFVFRDEWGAAPAKYKGDPMNFPIPHVILTYTSDTEKGETEEDCCRIMRDLQKKNMEEQGMSDIMYNFVIGSDGRVYEGRGWTSRPSNPKFPEFNLGRLDIAYMGNINQSNLPWEMYKPCLQLLNAGVDSKFLHEDYNLVEDPLVMYI